MFWLFSLEFKTRAANAPDLINGEGWNVHKLTKIQGGGNLILGIAVKHLFILGFHTQSMENAPSFPLSIDKSLVSKLNGVKILLALTFFITEGAL